ncbi:MAG: ABC transporter permease subunit [Nitriliruptorales bacterium]|nr:ABC transporter permease subunit [Nitriliruptorales bacterium]
MNALRIAGQSLRTYRRPLLIWTVAVGAMGLLQVLFWPAFESTAGQGMEELMANLPEALQALIGESDLLSPEGFINSRFSSVFPLLITVYAAFRATNETAGLEQDGGFELLLGAPLARWELLAGKFLAVATAVAAIMLGLGLLTVVGAVLVSMDIALSRILAAAVAMTFLGWAFAGFTFLVAGATGSRGVTLGAGAGAAVALFVWYSFSPLVDELEPFRMLSPYDHAIGYDPVRNGLQLEGTLVLLAVALVSFAGAVAMFNRRDVGT